ncbi:AlpA family phage regulatory protein [Nitrincola lacisaponensis]|uniref:helix-turn-helix transcriptional regulator n=1 Tax=Nitrincola lacisaponensis TaxID=267850 RepID=UPI0009FE0472
MTHSESYLSDKDIAQRYSIGRATVWRWITTRKFPSPVKLSPGCTRWKNSDVTKWEAEQEAKA